MKSVNKKLPKKNAYDCCTHYRTDTYTPGFIMFPAIKVKVCDNCGEVQLVANPIWSFLFVNILIHFWNGMVYMEESK